MAENIDIVIRARNATAATFKQVGTGLQGIDKAAVTAMSGLAALGATGIFAQVALDAAKAAKEVELLGNAFEGLAAKHGFATDDMLAGMKAASGGMIAEQDLMLSANRAFILNVVNSADEMAQLTDAARKFGAAMGLTTTQALTDMVTGIGRLSPLILDNLGIVIDAENTYGDYAASLGRTADSLTDVEKRQALLNRTLEQAETMVLPDVNEFEQMGAAVQELKVALGELFGPSMLAATEQMTLQVIAFREALESEDGKTIEGTTRLVRDAQKAIEEFNAAMGTGLLGTGMFTGFADSKLLEEIGYAQAEIDKYKASLVEMRREAKAEELSDLRQALSEVRAEMWELNPGADDFADKMEALGSRSASLKAQLSGVATASQGLAMGLGAVSDGADDAADAAYTVGNAWASVTGIFADAQAAMMDLTHASAKSRALDDLESKALDLVGILSNDEILAMNKEQVRLLEQASSEIHATSTGAFETRLGFEAATEAIGGTAESIKSAHEESQRLATSGTTIKSEFEKLFDSLTSKVGGLLSSFVGGDTAGIKAEDLLPRADAVDENARRLADIAVDGFKGQSWLDEFAAEAPDIYQQLVESADPKGTAARLLKDFQDGLIGDTGQLIDRDAAKAKIKRMILGEENVAAMAREIAMELATEMGVSLEAATKATESVLGGGKGTGGMVTSATQGLGQEVTSTLATEIEANSGILELSGQRAGASWGSGFLEVVGEHIPPELIRILTMEVTPGVKQALSLDAALTGATP